MDYISLANTRRRTTQLGFGFGGADSSATVLLDAAYDAGIRHFDVARSYGHGLSEGILGKFLKRHAGEVTVTTKFGIMPPVNSHLYSHVRRVLKPLVSTLKRWKAFDKKASAAISAMYKSATFSVTEAKQSLETSMRQLELDHVDVFLLHEPSLIDLGDVELLKFLQQSVLDGRIGGYGIGAKSSCAKEIFEQKIGYCPIVQTDWSVLNSAENFPGSFRIYYRTIGQLPNMFLDYFGRQPEICKSWSDSVDLDLKDPECIGSILLKAALLRNPAGIVLFSSHSPERIVKNVRRVEDGKFSKCAQLFLGLIAGQKAPFSIG